MEEGSGGKVQSASVREGFQVISGFQDGDRWTQAKECGLFLEDVKGKKVGFLVETAERNSTLPASSF